MKGKGHIQLKMNNHARTPVYIKFRHARFKEAPPHATQSCKSSFGRTESVNTDLPCYLRLRIWCQSHGGKSRLGHPVGHAVWDKVDIGRDRPQRILVCWRSRTQESGGRRLWREDSRGRGLGRGGRDLIDNRGRHRLGRDKLDILDIRASADAGGEDLLKALVAGDLFYRLEILIYEEGQPDNALVCK